MLLASAKMRSGLDRREFGPRSLKQMLMKKNWRKRQTQLFPPPPNSGLPEFGMKNCRSRIYPTSVWGRVREGVGNAARLLHRTTPTPDPSPQGGGEHPETAARSCINSIGNRFSAASHCDATTYFEIPSRSQIASIRAPTAGLMVSTRPHSRFVSAPILLVASMPSLPPSPTRGEAKSR